MSVTLQELRNSAPCDAPDRSLYSSLKPKHFPQHPVLKHPQSVLFLNMRDQETGVEVTILHVPSFPFLDSGQDNLVF